MKSGAPRSSSVARCSSPAASASPIAGSSCGTLLSSAASTSANFLLVSIFTCSTCNTCRVVVGSAIALAPVEDFRARPLGRLNACLEHPQIRTSGVLLPEIKRRHPARPARCGNTCQPLNGTLLVRPFGGSGDHVFRIEMSNPLAPHSDERLRRQLIHRFPRVFDGRESIPPDRAFAPFFALLLAFAGGTHGFPGDAIRLVDVLGGAFPALLMDQVKIAQGRLLVRHPLE